MASISDSIHSISDRIQKYRKTLIAAAAFFLALFFCVVFWKMRSSDNPLATSGWLYWGVGCFLLFSGCFCKNRNCRFSLSAGGILLLYPGLFCRNHYDGFFYAWMGLITLDLLGIFWFRRKKILFVILCNLLPVLIFCAGVVIWFNLEYFGRTMKASEYPCRPDADLGYVHVENRKIQCTLYHYWTRVLSTQMTLDPRGRRITPEYPPGQEMIFIGCSFTEGALLSDQDTLPYRIGKLSQRRVFNLGVSGYGIHQFQRMLELKSPWEKQIPADCAPSCIIYIGMTGHVNRIAHSKLPAYQLKNGQSTFVGSKNTDSFFLFDFISHGLIHNFLGIFLQASLFNRDPSLPDIRLYTASVSRCAELLKSRYPDSRFMVLYHDWDHDDVTETILQQLKEKQIQVILVSSLVKKQLSDPVYRIPYDGHPSALCWEEAAPELIKRIYRK